MGTRPKVVVTGVGFITSIGNDKRTVLENLKELRHGIELYPPFQKENIPVKVAAPVKGFKVESHYPEDWTFPDKYRLKLEMLRRLSPHGLYGYCALLQAIENAGLEREEISHPRTGLFTASAGSISNIYHHMSRLFKMGVQRSSPTGIISSVAGTLSFNLVEAFRIKGASSGFASACSSSGHALGYAFDEIANSRQDRMLIVAAEDGNLESILPFAPMRALSLSKDPDRSSRPFDRDRDGFVGAGGSVAIVLENEETARKRGVPIQAEFKGWGQASDGYHVVISHPEGEGLTSAIKNAFKCAGLSAGEIDYVNAHAPSTTTGDISEIRALRNIFPNGRERPAVSSTKALTGHGLSFSSIMEASFCILSLSEGFMPGSAHIENLDPEIRNMNIIRESREAKPRAVLSNSSGFGGANVALIFGIY